MKKYIIHYIDNLLFSYSTLLFMHNRIVGAILLITTFFNKNIAILGLISWITTFIFARFIGMKKDDVVHTIYTYNSLLVGFSIGFLFKITFLSVFLTIGTSILTVLLSYTLYSLFSYYLRLPVLNIPFTIVSTIIYLASVKYSALFVDSFYPHEILNIPSLPASIQGLLRTFGVLLFSPYDIIGILVLVAILVYSRISFILAVISYYLGISVLALLKGSYAQAFADISTFNFILVGMALGGIFLIPSKRSYTLALIGVIVSVFILDAVSVFWSSFGIPVFTLPFNIVVLLFVYVLMNIGYKRINLFIKESPEASLASFLNFRKRFDYVTPQPYLPFSGIWTVYQSFDDIWTHKGHWQYAYDFVITDDEDKTFRRKGRKLEDYFCYGKPVLSPISGTVIDVYDLLKDNPIGSVDKKNNWGNYIIIYSSLGYYVEISHLQTKSLQVKNGDFVKFGTILGKCGNSGYSPQPHIHMQVQYLPYLASRTCKFFISLCKNETQELLTNEVLKKNMKVEKIQVSRKHKKLFQFILDDVFKYKLIINGSEKEDIEIGIKMEIDGSYYFNIKGTDDKLFFGIENDMFVFYSFKGGRKSLLKYFFMALPKIPLTSDVGIIWKEFLPDNLLFNNNGLHLLLKSFNYDIRNSSGEYKLENEYEISGKISWKNKTILTKVNLDNYKGFRTIEIKMPDKEIVFQILK